MVAHVGRRKQQQHQRRSAFFFQRIEHIKCITAAAEVTGPSFTVLMGCLQVCSHICNKVVHNQALGATNSDAREQQEAWFDRCCAKAGAMLCHTHISQRPVKGL